MSAIPNPFGPRVCFCARHIVAMNKAVKDAGLWEQVSKTPAELQARLAKRNPYDVDPLLLLHNLVMGKCRHTAAMNGVQLFDQCPLCYFDVPEWIGEAATAIRSRMASLEEERLADVERSRQIEELQR